ncbi:17.1 kDa class II heat shock protein-like [Telopea speciosissima]|uniref:17.1 kDa class II heat shock protein-like n=1 Tax=Telopea speciosissima TaxID=54955 RepID=UPI001CC403E8|nr:17.1 kDa class II heat shock protein-like [Telopea speciosissima]
MDFRFMGLDNDMFKTIQHILDVADETEKPANAPSKTYVRDAKAMASTPADIKEYPNSYVFIIDMPGVKPTEITVQVEDNVLHVVGERKREEEEAEVKYVKMERRVGKFMRKFLLPENADTESISAFYQDGVLTVTVEKLPPPEPKKAKNIEVKIA